MIVVPVLQKYGVELFQLQTFLLNIQEYMQFVTDILNITHNLQYQ